MVKVVGLSLGVTRRVVFLGGRGSADDVSVAVHPVSDSALVVKVPARAASGPVAAVANALVRSKPSRPVAIVGLYSYVFPLRGHHSYGDGFGAARGGHRHQGQDVFASCGTPILAARGGRVQDRKFQSAAGNYVVIDGAGTGRDFFYAHLRKPSPLHVGDRVSTGQQIGTVGQTGDATACHLHFEMWTAPGWYEGGHAFDPRPFLKDWDKYS
jgi:murein DD-endopeptidase MepM/ murein hydrolase activator NlpD